MKVLISLILCAAISFAGAQTTELSREDRENLLERLREIREAADSRVDARFRVAISAYRAGMGSDEQAYSLYMKCIEKVDFIDQKKSGQDFREWRRGNDDRLKDPAFRRVLRHQLRWLVLSLQAASQDADRTRLAASAQEILDTIVADASNLTGHHRLLNQAVTGTVFARAYEIGEVNIDGWVLAPARIGEIYERILLEPHRIARRPQALRAGWTKRIQQEIALFEAWRGQSDRGGSRIGMASANLSPEYQKFLGQEVPNLQWRMEVDVFQHGDPAGAAARMLELLNRHATHSSVREWVEEFEGLLTPDTEATRSTTVDGPLEPEHEPKPEPEPEPEPEPMEEESIFIE